MNRRFATAWACLSQFGAVLFLGAGALGIKNPAVWLFTCMGWEVIVLTLFVYHRTFTEPDGET